MKTTQPLDVRKSSPLSGETLPRANVVENLHACHEELAPGSGATVWIMTVTLLGMSLVAGYLLWAKVTFHWPFA